MKLVYSTRMNGSPCINVIGEKNPQNYNNPELLKVSEPVSYQGIASLTLGSITYIAVGDYYDGHTPMVPGKIYSIIEAK